ncbi:MAG: right-handed parallel beta-helix repeat-containing protein [Planctomycetota bacterium]|jgi:parallel beta-helix repeat protein
MKKLILTVAIAVFTFAGRLCGTIINIPDDFPTIQQGIDASFNGDTVLVQPGYYVEHIGFGGHNIVLASLFLTTGDSSYIWDTSIAGDSSGTVVSFGAGEDTTAMLIGFSIENGAEQSGGGIYCDNSSNPTIMSNLIMDNHAIPYTGGGIWCRVSNPRIIGNIIRDNTAESGGAGISLLDSNPLIKDNLIFFNGASTHGGGILCVQSNPTIMNNRIYGNYAPYGGGIGSTDSDPVITGNLIYENVAASGAGISFSGWGGLVKNNVIFSNLAVEQGGGVNFYDSNPLLVNNVIYGNESEAMAGAISCVYFSGPEIMNTIIWDNIAQSFPEIFVDTSSSLTITYSDIRFGWEGEGNIDIDPLFRYATNGNFHLRSEACDDTSNSPCIDMGSPAILDSLLDCDWGLEFERSDMGAFGGGDTITVAIDDCMERFPSRFTLYQNYPNPFNSSTSIRLSLRESQTVSVTVYDLLGREVQTLLDEYRQSGIHHITFNASDLASGVYFYRLWAGESVESKRMVLIK